MHNVGIHGHIFNQPVHILSFISSIHQISSAAKLIVGLYTNIISSMEDTTVYSCICMPTGKDVSSLLGMRTKRSISTAVGHAMCLPAIMRVQRCSVGNSVPAVHSKFCVSSYMLPRACTLYNHNHNHKSYKNNITFFGLDVVSQTNI